MEGETNPETLDLDIPGEASTNKDLKPMVRITVAINESVVRFFRKLNL